MTSLGFLLTRYQQPLVVCFDRLENLETDEHIHALGKMVEFLVDKAQAMLPVVCFRGMQWEEKFRHKLNQHVSSRLETNKFELRGCHPHKPWPLCGIVWRRCLAMSKRRPFSPSTRKNCSKRFTWVSIAHGA